MDPELKDAFARSGLVHLLSISGFHVGLIMAWLVVLLARSRSPHASARARAAAATAYVAFLGWPARRPGPRHWDSCLRSASGAAAGAAGSPCSR
jgi:hypothetical protein